MKQDENIEDKTFFVSSHNVKVDNTYSEWLKDIKHRYRSAQVKAAVRVNAEKLLFNWQLGRDLVMKKAEERWGAGVVEQISLDLQKEFPEEKGFSASNLWFMKRWYLFYTENASPEKVEQLVKSLQIVDNKMVKKLDQVGQVFMGEKLHQVGGVSTSEKVHQVGGELQTVDNKDDVFLDQFGQEFPIPFALVPWRHHIEILKKCKTVDEAFFYIGKTIEQGLSREALINCIKADLYNTQGRILNNFSEILPPLQSKLVQEVLKENYDFGFATVDHSIYDEKELEDALLTNITDLLLEMGTGFAFIARQKELVVDGRTRRIDLLFYHIRLRCYIVCELKAKQFEPEYAGKLNFYVNAVDELLKADDDNPTIGLLICSDMKSTEVQWSFRGINTPMGVATYNNIKIKDALPSQELLKQRMELFQKEFVTKGE